MRTSSASVAIRAPRETVWRVVTDPDLVKQWQYGSTLNTDWQVGSSIRFISEWEGQRFEQWGTVLEVEAPTRIRYSLFAPRPGIEERPEDYFTMTYELADEDGDTLLTFVQIDPRSPSEDVADSSEADSAVLRGVKELAESLARREPS